MFRPKKEIKKEPPQPVCPWAIVDTRRKRGENWRRLYDKLETRRIAKNDEEGFSKLEKNEI